MHSALSWFKIHLWCKSIVKTLHYFYGMESYCSLCTLDTIHRLLFATRLIINQINKVQWVDFKLKNVLISLHSLKTMSLGTFGASAPLFLRNGELLGHSPILIDCPRESSIDWNIDNVLAWWISLTLINAWHMTMYTPMKTSDLELVWNKIT